MWRVHAVWSLDDERFSCFELTDEKEGERLDRAAVIPHGFAMLRMDVRSASSTRFTKDWAFLQPERIARVLADGGDVVIRAPS